MFLLIADGDAWIPVWMAAIALGVATISFLGNLLTAVMQYLTKRSVDEGNQATAAAVSEAATTRQVVAKTAEVNAQKLASAMQEIHVATNSLADRLAKKSEEAGLQTGINQERNRTNGLVAVVEKVADLTAEKAVEQVEQALTNVIEKAAEMQPPDHK